MNGNRHFFNYCKKRILNKTEQALDTHYNLKLNLVRYIEIIKQVTDEDEDI